MDNPHDNKKLVLEYIQAISGEEKSESLIRRYVADEKLIEHLLFFEKIFPLYRQNVEEILSEDDRVLVRGVMQGRHEGALPGILPSQREIQIPIAICFRISGRMIVDHWMIADELELMEQLGLLDTEDIPLPGNWKK